MNSKVLKLKKARRTRRHARVTSRVQGTSTRPRLVVFRSLSNIYAQLVDDTVGKTLAEANSSQIKTGKKTEQSTEVGKLIAQKAQALKITKVVFDRGGNKYHGRVKALADGARAGGLEF